MHFKLLASLIAVTQASLFVAAAESEDSSYLDKVQAVVYVPQIYQTINENAATIMQDLQSDSLNFNQHCTAVLEHEARCSLLQLTTIDNLLTEKLETSSWSQTSEYFAQTPCLQEKPTNLSESNVGWKSFNYYRPYGQTYSLEPKCCCNVF
ncbi:MAG: hypothetical protein LBL32_03155 [Holosporales bacterium]|jgi:hypothetical protein|nr:hypothetical protein [Holosporales bacterium]